MNRWELQGKGFFIPRLNDLWFVLILENFLVFFHVLCKVWNSFFENVNIFCQLCFLASRTVQRLKSVSRNRWSLSLWLKVLGPWSSHKTAYFARLDVSKSLTPTNKVVFDWNTFSLNKFYLNTSSLITLKLLIWF